MKNSILVSALVPSFFLFTGFAGDWGKSPKAVTYESTSLFYGDLEATLGHTWVGGEERGGSEASSFWSGGGVLQLGMDLSSYYFAQLDVLGELTDVARSDDSYKSGYGMALHLMRRNSDAGGIGLFGGFIITDQDNDSTDTSERYFGGVEGQLFQGNTTYFGQVGYFGGTAGSDDQGRDSLHDAGFVRLGAQRFVTESLMLGAEVSAAFGSMDTDGDDVTVLSWGVKAEKQITDRLSGTLGYLGGNYYQHDEGDRITENMVYLSLTYLFDQGTLQSRNRNSTSLDLPSILRWSGQTGGPLE